MTRLLQQLVVAALFVVTAAAGQARAAEVLLQSAMTGQFVRVQGGTLAASGHADNAVRLELVRLQGSKVAFRSRDGSYVRAGVGQQTLLAAGSPHVRGWETFEMVPGNRGVSLRSVQNGKFVTVDGRTGRLSATGRTRGASTEFNMPGAPRDNAAQGGGNRPQVRWDGNWTQIWIASPNGNLHRPPSSARAQFSIGRDMSVSTTMGCNRLNTRLTVDGQRARYAGVVQTKRLCGNELDGYERGMSIAFQSVRGWEFREGQIAFLDQAGRTVLRIAR